MQKYKAISVETIPTYNKYFCHILQNYIGFGLSGNKYEMRNADVVVCLRDGKFNLQ